MMITVLCLGVVMPAGCGGGGMLAVAGSEPVKNVVEVENTRSALKAWTTARARADVLVLVDPTDEMAAFPEKIMGEVQNAAKHLKRGNVEVINVIFPWIENGGSVNLGYMAGMYRRVIWVVPSAIPVGDMPLTAYLDFLERSRGIPRAELRDFARDDKWLTGTIAGVPVTITRLADLSLAKGTSAIIHINIAYFPAMKAQDPMYRTGTASLIAFIKELRDKDLRVPIITVDRASRTGLVGVDIRFFGDVIKEAFQDPRTIAGPLPEKWEGMEQAEDSLVAKRYEGAAAIYGELARGYPHDAGLQFSLAIACGLAGRGIESRAAIYNAYHLDGEYLRGFFQLANVLGATGDVEAGLEILDSPDLASIYPKEEIEYQKGVFYYVANRPKDAITYLAAAAARRQKDFGLYVMLFKTQKALGDITGQIYTLQAIIDMDEARVKREAPWIYSEYGQLAEKIHYLGSANEMYQKYVEAVPDDSLATVFKKKMAEWKAKNLIKPRPKQRTITIGAP
jgi:hypothetical protein